MNTNSDMSKLLTMYTQITENIYLKNNNKIVAIVQREIKDNTEDDTEDNSNKYVSVIGFLKIRYESRTEFTGTGLILKGKALETVIQYATDHEYTTEGTKKHIHRIVSTLAKYVIENNNTTKKDKRIIPIREEHIKTFASQNNNCDNIARYLDAFSEIPCEEHASKDYKYKLRKLIKSDTKLKYHVINLIDLYSSDIYNRRITTFEKSVEK